MTNFIGAGLFLFSLTAFVNGEELSYKNYKLYDVQPSTRVQLEALQDVHDGPQVDFWSSPSLGRGSSVMVSPNSDQPFRVFLEFHNITHKLLNEDVQGLIDQERDNQRIHLRKRRDAEGDGKRSVEFDHFWTLAEIYDYVDYLATTYPEMVRVKDFGTTHEGRPIKVITISSKGEVNLFRPVVLIDGGMHAREWAGHMSVVHLIYQLVERSTENMDLLVNTDWVIMPVANPDGYVYAHEKNRLWRKNRAPANAICSGTDLNRNFPFRWAYNGAECSSGYAGPTPASELETRAVMLMMATYARATKVYLAVHTCGDFILYPYGYDYVMAPNAQQLQELGDRAARAVEAINGPKYRVGSAAVLLYPANGSDDFIYGSFGVDYAYTLELSCAESGDGFIVTVTEMQKIIKEAFEMFKVYGHFAGEQTIAPVSAHNIKFADRV